MLKPAAPGTGVIAGGAVRAVMESAGVRDILTKTLGSTNKANTVQACIKALRELRSPDTEALRRGKTVVEIVGRKQAERITIANANAAEQAAAMRAAREEEARETRATSNRGRSGGDRNDRGDRRGGGNAGGSNDRRGGGGSGDRRGGGGGGSRR